MHTHTQQTVNLTGAAVLRMYACRQHEEGEGDEGEVEQEEQEFSPEKGNVVFGSAYDGWAFRTSQFAEMYAGGFNGSSWGLRTVCLHLAYETHTKYMRSAYGVHTK